MRLLKIAAMLAAALVAMPVAAQRTAASLPAATTLTGSEKIVGSQGPGCSASTGSCTTVNITPAQLATYIGASFQPKDSDLDAIAALATQPFGRSVLTQADAASLRSLAGVTATGQDTTYLYRANNLSGLTDVSAARGNLGLGAAATQTYATGTFTPIVQFGTNSAGMTYSTQAGRYTRIGRLVTVDILIQFTAKGTSTGSARISGLPFLPMTDQTGAVAIALTKGMSSVTSVIGTISTASSVWNLYNGSGTTYAALTDTNFTDSSQLIVSFTYAAQ